jgi:hypothetical protein
MYLKVEGNNMTTFKEKILANYDKEELLNISIQGCISGCASGLIYYHETCAVYEKYSNEIWNLLYDKGVEYDYPNVMEFISSFTGCKNVGGKEQFENLLVWWYAEQIAYQFINTEEREDEN